MRYVPHTRKSQHQAHPHPTLPAYVCVKCKQEWGAWSFPPNHCTHQDKG